MPIAQTKDTSLSTKKKQGKTGTKKERKIEREKGK